MVKDEVTVQVFNFIRTYQRQHGFAPSIREISRGCYLSPSNVWRYLDRLEAWGWIRRELNKARTIVILRQEDG
jgi:repressor LexA